MPEEAVIVDDGQRWLQPAAVAQIGVVAGGQSAGYGRFAREVAARLVSFGCRITVYAPRLDADLPTGTAAWMERRDGKWRIAKRAVIADSETIETIEGSWLNLALLKPSRRDPSDFSYVR